MRYKIIILLVLPLLFSCDAMFFDPEGRTFQRVLRLTSPNGNEVWTAGTTHNITWDSFGKNHNNVDFFLSMFPDTVWEYIGSPSNNGEFLWQIPHIASSSNTCLLKIQGAGGDVSYWNIFDISDTYFTLVADSVFYKVTNPNGGEVWSEGNSYGITWNSGGYVGSEIRLSLSMDPDTNWIVLGPPTWNDGVEWMRVPEILRSSNTCLVKIHDYFNSSLYDISDAYFTIENVN